MWDAWQQLPFAADFANFGGGFQAMRFRKSSDGEVQLEGVATKPTAGAANQVVGTLPVGYRPPLDLYVVGISSNSFARWRINDDGNVILTPAAGIATVLALSARFSTDEVTFAGPLPTPPPGQQPFAEFGQVQDREGNILAEVAVSIWRDTSSTSASEGEQYDYLATCSINGADALVEKSNRLLVVGATTYRVLDATRYDVLPHLELSLRRVLP